MRRDGIQRDELLICYLAADLFEALQKICWLGFKFWVATASMRDLDKYVSWILRYESIQFAFVLLSLIPTTMHVCNGDP